MGVRGRTCAREEGDVSGMGGRRDGDAMQEGSRLVAVREGWRSVVAVRGGRLAAVRGRPSGRGGSTSAGWCVGGLNSVVYRDGHFPAGRDVGTF